MANVRRFIRGSVPGQPLPLAHDRELIQDSNDGSVYIGYNGSNKLVSNNTTLQAQIDELKRRKILDVPAELTGRSRNVVRVKADETGFELAEESADVTAARNAAASSALGAAASAIAASNRVAEATAAKDETVLVRNEAVSAKNESSAAASLSAASASDAHNSADIASAASQTASMANAPAYSPSTSYSFPDVVAYTDGGTYRCLGTDVIGDAPNASSQWAKLAVVWNDFFEADSNGDVMPTINPVYSNDFETDSNGDIMPML